MYYGEKFNSITHLVGAVLSLIGFGALVTIGITGNRPMLLLSFTVFGFTQVLLYTMSTLYHSIPSPGIKRIFRKLDHIAIYLLIAGTYTPYMLVSLADSGGPLLLAVVWGLALIGLLIDTLNPNRIELLQLLIYLLMGWLCMLKFTELRTAMPAAGVIWLTVGGITYTAGILFYVLDTAGKLRHAHGIWHLFVLCGSISHFISIIVYVR